jgi:hypothetical protein
MKNEKFDMPKSLSIKRVGKPNIKAPKLFFTFKERKRENTNWQDKLKEHGCSIMLFLKLLNNAKSSQEAWDHKLG